MPSPMALAAKKKLDSNFLRRGILTAVFSGMSYGIYTAFMTLAMTKGIWAEWYDPDKTTLSAFAVTFLLAALGAAATDSCSACWAIIVTTIKGKLGDFVRCIKSKPGMVMVAAALIGGPLASTCYVVGIQLAGSIIVPVSALCPTFGAILARILFKQPLTPRMMLGIAICVAATFMIGSVGLGDEAPQNLFLGLFFGLLAAFGWGVEGSICGYGTSLIDPEIGITIRQVTSSLSNLFILVPVLVYFSDVNAVDMVVAAFDPVAMPWFLIAGIGAYFAFMCWYKGNAMCGAALGMSCNGMFSFWGPFFSWIVLGVVFGSDPTTALAPIAWAAAVVMVIGIFTIATNPLNFFKKRA